MQHRRLLVAAPVVVLLFAGFLSLRQQLGIEFSPESLREVIERMGVWGPLIYVTLVAFRVPLGFPSQVVLLGGGLVFGAGMGTLYGAAGLAISAVALFIGARWAGRAVVEEKLPDRLRPLLEIAGSRAGLLFIAVGTGYPFGPVTMYHLMAGVTGMSLAGFTLAASLGSLMRSWIFTFFGSTLASGELDNLLQAAALFTLALVVPLLFRGPRSWLLHAAGRRPMTAEIQSSESRR